MKTVLYILIFLATTGLLGLGVVYVQAQTRSSTNYAIERDSLNSGGRDISSSSNYVAKDTVGEQGTGELSSTNYALQAGYRQMAESNISISAVADFSLGSIGGVTGGSAESTRGWNVTTDNPAGYELSVRASTSPALENTTATGSFADYSASGDPDFTFSITSSESAFGFTPEGDDITAEYQDDGSSCNTGSQDTASRCWRGFATSDEVVAQATDNNQPAGATTSIRFRAESGSSNVQPAGTYQTTIIVTAVAL